jgi:hypothetical protein
LETERPGLGAYVLLAALAVACGGGAPSAKLSGAVNAAVAISTFGTPTVSDVMFVISPPGSGTIPISGGMPSVDGGMGVFPSYFSVVIIPGTSLQTGTFTNANASYAISEVQASAFQADGLWIQYFSDLDPSSQLGTFSLSISSVGSITTTDAGAPQWTDSHGTLSATLPASTYSPDAGTVTVDVIF